MLREGAMNAENKVENVRMAKRLLSRSIELAGRAMQLLQQSQDASHQLTVDAIVLAVCDKCGLTKEALLAQDRSASITRARILAMFVARKCTTQSLPEIAQAFKRTHASVISAVKRHQALMETDDGVHQETLSLIRELGVLEKDVD